MQVGMDSLLLFVQKRKGGGCICVYSCVLQKGKSHIKLIAMVTHGEGSPDTQGTKARENPPTECLFLKIVVKKKKTHNIKVTIFKFSSAVVRNVECIHIALQWY